MRNSFRRFGDFHTFFQADYENGILRLQCTEAKHNLVRVLHCLEEQEIHFGRVFPNSRH